MVEQYQLGLASDGDHLGRLSIPFTTPTGVVGIRYRCLEPHKCEGHPKYLQEKGAGDRLYNVGALHERHPAVAITEGEIDAMFMDTHVMPCVATTGATKWPAHWSRLFEDYDRVFLIGDGNDAGRRAVESLLERLDAGQIVMMPEGMDVNDYFLLHGAEGLSAYVLGD